MLPIVFRDAWFGNAIVLVCGVEEIGSQPNVHRALSREIDGDCGITLIESGATPLPWSFEVDGLQRVEMPLPTRKQRYDLWASGFEGQGKGVREERIAFLADSFQLTSQEIRRIIKATIARCNRTRVQEAGEIASTFARDLVNSSLRSLTSEIYPKYTWDDIVLPSETRRQLEQICHRVTYRTRVMDEWGFGAKLSLGKGTNALFSGPSGTGKTMAAEVIANELNMPLFRIDLATVVSKYIGETEKNLRKIFSCGTACQCGPLLRRGRCIIRQAQRSERLA